MNWKEQLLASKQGLEMLLLAWARYEDEQGSDLERKAPHRMLPTIGAGWQRSLAPTNELIVSSEEINHDHCGGPPVTAANGLRDGLRRRSSTGSLWATSIDSLAARPKWTKPASEAAP